MGSARALRLHVPVSEAHLQQDVEYAEGGLTAHRIGRLLELLPDGKTAVVKPPGNPPPIKVPLRRIWIIQQAPPRRPLLVAQLRAPSAPPVPRVVHRGARVDGRFSPVERPRRRIVDPDYTDWQRQRSCCFCGPNQRTETQVAHLGPRGVSRRTHDWFVNGLCFTCHIEWWHGQGHLPGLDKVETTAFLLRDQLLCLLCYFGPPLGRDADRWQQLGELGTPMAAPAAAEHYRLILDCLLPRLLLITRQGGSS